MPKVKVAPALAPRTVDALADLIEWELAFGSSAALSHAQIAQLG